MFVVSSDQVLVCTLRAVTLQWLFLGSLPQASPGLGLRGLRAFDLYRLHSAVSLPHSCPGKDLVSSLWRKLELRPELQGVQTAEWGWCPKPIWEVTAPTTCLYFLELAHLEGQEPQLKTTVVPWDA